VCRPPQVQATSACYREESAESSCRAGLLMSQARRPSVDHWVGPGGAASESRELPAGEAHVLFVFGLVERFTAQHWRQLLVIALQHRVPDYELDHQVVVDVHELCAA
jgi:hypothetical protein